MTILVTGGTGLVGSHLAENKEKDWNLLTPRQSQLDITNKQAVAQFFSDNQPEIIVHFAAYTDLNVAEAQRDDLNGSVWQINVEGTQHIAEMAMQQKTYFIHISTDMVFSGKKDDPGPYREDHPIETEPNRCSWYGWTKAQAEKIVSQMPSPHAIVRIANPVRAHYGLKQDHIHKIISAYESGDKLRLFTDQHLTLTYISEATVAIKKLIKTRQNGIFHVSSTNRYTPFNLATYLLYKKYGVKDVVEASSLEEYIQQTGLMNRYVQYSGLEVMETQKKLGMKFRTWEEIIDELIKEGLK